MCIYLFLVREMQEDILHFLFMDVTISCVEYILIEH